ncbi:sodium/glutamate symporter [Lawsonibacter asaccharolyticus]|uniref:sodium/glutamate symporter n=2 Tax=Clostridium TaxID=1485 RepID=UPI000D291ED7|nr:sodium/glutamate symporter [Lawsonibacter asaccharolyticus]
METLTMNMVQTTGFAIIVLLIGMLVRKKVRFFTKYCIPAPVIGGLIFSIVTTILRSANILEFDFDTTLQSFFQIMYFCTIGFAASFKMLKVGGSKVVKFLVIASIFALLQDVLAVGLADTVGIEPLLALMTASPALTGGMGTSAAVAPSVEALGYSAATTVAVTAATFGILCGSVMGGPVATRLIERHDLFRKFQTRTTKEDSFDLSILEDKKKFLSSKTICSGMFVILLCMGIGAYVTNGINSVVGNFVDGVSFPAYLGAMLIACIFRNVTDHSTVFGELPKEEMDALGDAARNVFLGIALMSLELWELVNLAIPMLILLLLQVVLAYIFANFICFPLMGRDYDAAMISCGLIGFGMGSTSNAIANMDAVSAKYAYSKTPYFVVPIVGALFIDFINIFIIFGFIGFLQ